MDDDYSNHIRAYVYLLYSCRQPRRTSTRYVSKHAGKKKKKQSHRSEQAGPIRRPLQWRWGRGIGVRRDGNAASFIMDHYPQVAQAPR